MTIWTTTNPAEATLAEISTHVLYCTGFGQFDTHAETLSSGEKNKSPKGGTDYTGITGKEIVAMVRNPPSGPKEKAQWFIPSTYRASDGRDFGVQRDKGEFWFLPLDEDGNTDNNLSLDDIDGALKAVCGDVARLVYSTRGSTKEKRKWRGLVPLAKSLSGSDYEDTVAAFNALLIEASEGVLIPDAALERPAQLIFLPNRGKHYEHAAHGNDRLSLAPDHPIIVKREAIRAERASAEAELSNRSEARQRAALADPDGSTSMIEAFNNNTTVAGELARYGYQPARNQKDWKSPNSSSGSYAVRDYGDFWISYSGSDAEAGIGNKTSKGACIGDAFDLYVHYDHGGDRKAAIRTYAKEIGMDHETRRAQELAKGLSVIKTKAGQTDVNPAALRLAENITRKIRTALPDLKADPCVDAIIIRDMIEGAFWSGVKSKMFLLNEAESLVQFPASEAWRFLCRRFGSPVDIAEILNQLEATIGGKLKPVEELKAKKAINSAVIGQIIDHLKYVNQLDAVEWSVDMFGQRARLERNGDVIRIILTHKPLACDGAADPECIKDYKEHFPLLDEFLEYIVASRFALDRKKSYLWMLATSDWGKGFIMGVLTSLGLVVQMSVKEIEAVLEGKPSGRAPEDFKRAMILAVDEFKTVKTELKQLQSEIQLAPKYQLTSRVEIFTKLFLSAESVGSLVGEHGVEDQFANRMSMLTGKGTLNGRAIYDHNQGKYYRAVRKYVAEKLNRLIEKYQALGREAAEQEADKYINAFIGKHGLDQYFDRLSESYPAIAEQAIAWVRKNCIDSIIKTFGDNGADYLTSPNKMFEDFLKENYSMSEISTLRRRKTEIMELMSEDGAGPKSHKVGGRTLKALKLIR